MRFPDLSLIPFLRDVSDETLAQLREEIDWFSLPGGMTLFEAGDVAEAIYFVTSGALGAFRRAPNGEQELLGYIRSGEPVGEMALIAGETHSASVYAVRDTEIVRLNRAAFFRFVRQQPSVMHNLARIMLARSRLEKRRSARAEPKVFAFFSTSPTIDLKFRASMLKRAIETLGKRCAIAGAEAESRSSVFFEDLERWHDVVILYSPIEDSPWYKLCLRQADRVWLFGRTDAKPSAPLMPDDPGPARRFRLVDLILLHPSRATPQATRTAHWVEAAAARRLFHWQGDSEADAMRLARTMTGLSIGLVLSGGGARAYAHIGVYEALREAGAQIDFVGGTSMGAIIAACIGLGWSQNEIEQRIRKAFVDSNPLADYVLPVVALTRGREVDKRLAEHFGGALIEDMALPFFAVSTNLTAGAANVHRQGVLRHALRATIALPGILPPVVEDEHILVDGAVTNNLPTDVMQEWHRGLTIAVDVAREGGINAADFVDPPSFTKWVAKNGFKSPPPIASLLMRTATLNVNPWKGRERSDLLIVPEIEGVELRDWKAFDVAVAAGYQAAVEALRSQGQGLIARLRPRRPQSAESDGYEAGFDLAAN